MLDFIDNLGGSLIIKTALYKLEKMFYLICILFIIPNIKNYLG